MKLSISTFVGAAQLAFNLHAKLQRAGEANDYDAKCVALLAEHFNEISQSFRADVQENGTVIIVEKE